MADTSNLAYQPEPGSLAARVCTWLRQNSEEELTASDIGRKFDVPANSAAACLASSITRGFVVTRRDEISGRVYVAGPKLGEFDPGVPSTADIGKATSLAKRPKRSMALPPPLDIDAIKIEPGVPKPSMATPAGASYRKLIAKMKVGDSVLLPIAQATRLQSLAMRDNSNVGGSQKWSLRKLDESQARVWRDA